MFQNEIIPNNNDIEIDPIIINTQIVSLYDSYEDFIAEFKKAYNEYNDLIIKFDENENEKDLDFIINSLSGNLRKIIDICEIYLKELKNKSINTYSSTINIPNNYDFKHIGKENKLISDTVSNFISFQYDLNFYNDSLIIWNDVIQDPIYEDENSEIKHLKNVLKKYLGNLIIFNKEYLSQICIFESEIINLAHENNNKLLLAAMSCKSLNSYIKYTTIEIKNKQSMLFGAFDDLADYINNIENESNPEDALDYIVDIIKNNIEWPFLFQYIINKLNSTLMTYTYDYLEENFNNFSSKQINQLKNILSRFLIPHKCEMSKLLKIFTETSELSEHKSELISYIELYLDRLENSIFEVKRFLMKYEN